MIFGEEYVFFCTKPTIHTSLYITNFHFFSIHFFFIRRESRSLKMEIIRQTYPATKAEGELSELKRNEQHRANLRTQISINVMETTPMSSPSSFCGGIETSQGKEGKKCNWCQIDLGLIPFNCFETQRKRLECIRNCKKSRGQ